MKNKKHKIIFLDIDGVLSVYPEWSNSWIDNGANNIVDTMLVKNLKQVIDATDARIVISSSWRLYEKLFSDLCDKLEQNGIKKEFIIGKTENLEKQLEEELEGLANIDAYAFLRLYEIKQYINEHKDNIENYIIIDDLNIDKYNKGNFIKTDKKMGLTTVVAEKCIKMLMQ